MTEASEWLDDSIKTLKEVQIISHRNSAIFSQTLSGGKLQAMNNNSVVDAIRYFSGVQIKDFGGVGGMKTVDVRSMGSNYTAVFYDGMQIGNAQNGQTDLSKFSLDNVEAITLYHGQKNGDILSARDYLSAASIYIRSRMPQFDKNKSTNIAATLRAGSFGIFNQSLLLEQKVYQYDSLRYIAASFNVEYFSANGRYPFRYKKVLNDGAIAWDTTAIRQNGDIQAIRCETGLNGRMKKGFWQSKIYYYQSEKGIPGAIVNNVWKNSQRQWDKNFFVQGLLREKITDNYEMLVNIKYANDIMRYLSNDTTIIFVDNVFSQQEFYASLVHKIKIAEYWHINIATDYMFNTLDGDFKFAPSENLRYVKRHTPLAVVSANYDNKNFTAQASLLASYYEKTLLSPSLLLSYNILPSLMLKGFYKNIFRIPTFNELYYTDFGYATLKPELASMLDIGIMYKSMFLYDKLFLNFNLDFYYNDVRDKIISVPKGNSQFRWMCINIGHVVVKGIEMSANIETQFSQKMQASLMLNYTYQKAQDFSDKNDATTYLGQIAYIPLNSGSVVVYFNYKEFDVNYSFVYVGDRYRSSENIPENYEQPWYTHDCSISKTFNIKKCSIASIKISAEINNIFNQYYDIVQHYPMPGRNYKISLKFTV
ncbi:ligand-gated channel [Bacteroidia bacterium]|nr:ligand-gated channel [Bacteroidia bacterium]